MKKDHLSKSYYFGLGSSLRSVLKLNFHWNALSIIFLKLLFIFLVVLLGSVTEE